MYLSLALGAVTLIMAYLGYHYSVPRGASPRKRWLLRIVFGGLAGLSFLLIVIQGHKADESEKEAKLAQARLADSMDRLGRQTGEVQHDEAEIKRVQGLNTELQNKLLNQSGQLIESSRRISQLSKEGIE